MQRLLGSADSTDCTNHCAFVALWFGATVTPCSLRAVMHSPTVRRSCQLSPGRPVHDVPNDGACTLRVIATPVTATASTAEVALELCWPGNRVKFDEASKWRRRWLLLLLKSNNVAIGTHRCNTNACRANVDDKDAVTTVQAKEQPFGSKPPANQPPMSQPLRRR